MERDGERSIEITIKRRQTKSFAKRVKKVRKSILMRKMSKNRFLVKNGVLRYERRVFYFFWSSAQKILGVAGGGGRNLLFLAHRIT